ncbi:hypothetical protein CTAYLR_000178 [Chrysophaeum taylorii]|uniref:Uncharacterized protein n=1 Tax=Chrysophaeum taylorii TaxID=2483200 RepID=A0AAD7UEJ6_9STRA|nr:hypothetical protein CTAYLR_000178 [Chrysophaeum taylorii]
MSSFLPSLLALAGLAATQEERAIRGVLVFKTARSGSSWLSGLLGRLARVRFYGEVIEWKTCSHYTPTELAGYLDALLTRDSVPKLARHNKSSVQALLAQPRVGGCGESPTEARGAFASPKGACAAVPFAAVLRLTCAKVVLFLRTNLVKMAIARIHDNKVGWSPKICGESRRRLGRGANLHRNCTYVPKRLNVTVRLFMSFLKGKAIQENERLVDAVSSLDQPDSLTMTYENLQRDRAGELEKFKRFVGLEWRGLGGEGLDEQQHLVKAAPDDPRLALTTELWGALDLTFRNTSFSSSSSSFSSRQLVDCLLAMLRAAGPVDFNYAPCVPSFDHQQGRTSGMVVETFAAMYNWIPFAD